VITAPRLDSAATAISPDQAARIDKLFAPWNRPGSPGCVVAVMKGGGIVYEHGFGMADLEHNVEIAPSTVFHVGSISKQFTAAAVLMLARDSRLSLDDPIRKYVPEVPDFGTPITLRELLHHTSGLRDWEELLVFDGWRIYGDVVTDADVLAAVSRQKDLNFPPGSEFTYSNTGYSLLAQVVARVSRQSFPDFTASQIFRPLGMRETHFRDNHSEIIKKLAHGYQEAHGSFEVSDPNLDTVGPTNLMTTVEDLARWDENFYSGRVGGSDVLKQMTECGKLNNGKQIIYGAGLFVDPSCGQKVAEHSGSDAGYVADMIRFPPQHLSVVTLCNLVSIDVIGLTHSVAEISGAKLPTPPPSQASPIASVRPKYQPTAKELSEFAGVYRSLEIEIPYTVRADGVQLTMHALKIGSVPMLPVAADEFTCTQSEPSNVQNWRVRFTRDEQGLVTGFLIDTNYFTRHLQFVRGKASPARGQ
jgi:CubicO group peptidase (beta-lactamase class C family)